MIRHVLFIADTPVTGGATNCMVELIDCLVKDYGVHCTVCTTQQSELNERLATIGADSIVTGHGAFLANISKTVWKRPLSLIKWTLDWKIRGLHALRVAERSIDFTDIDIIHSNLPRNDLGEKLAKRHGIPHVCHLRENSFEDFGLVSLKPHPERYLSDNSDVLIAVSNSVKTNWTKRGVDPTKIRVIYDGISVCDTDASQSHFALHGAESTKKLRVIFLGGYDPAKGTMDIVDAVSALEQGVREKLKVSIYGPWRESAYGRLIQHLVWEKKLSDTIELCGYADNVPQLLGDFDVGLACSKNEAFGRIILDYRAAGLAVVAARAGSFPELIEDGVDGLLYSNETTDSDLADILKELICDRSLVMQLSSARRSIRTEKDVAKDVMNLYEECLTRAPDCRYSK